MRGALIGWTLTVAATLLLSIPAWAGNTDSGSVKVINDTDFTLEILMDSKAQFTLGPGAKQTVTDITPGLHEFKAVTAAGDVKFDKSMKVTAGQTLSWYLKWTRAEGLLVIDNPNGVPVTVVIDGQPTLGVGALDFRSYGNLGAGTHDLRVTYSMVSGEGELLTSQVSIDGITPVALTLPLNPTADSVSPDEPLRYKD